MSIKNYIKRLLKRDDAIQPYPEVMIVNTVVGNESENGLQRVYTIDGQPSVKLSGSWHTLLPNGKLKGRWDAIRAWKPKEDVKKFEPIPMTSQSFNAQLIAWRLTDGDKT